MKYKVALLSEFSKQEYDLALTKLPLSEQAYINNKPKDKAYQSIGARILLSRLIEQETGEEILKLLERDENKKPFIKGKKDLFISISHSENCVAAAVSSKPIGVDVQKIKQIKPSLIKRALTPLEQEFANSNDVSAFYRLWTAKEALIKTGEYTYSEAFNFSFVKNGKIVCPEGFKIEQRYYEDFLICTIEKE